MRHNNREGFCRRPLGFGRGGVNARHRNFSDIFSFPLILHHLRLVASTLLG